MARKIAAVIMGASLTAVLFAGPASAEGPEIQTIPVVISEDGLPCGDGISFDLDLEGRFTVMTFSDREAVKGLIDGSAVASTGATLRFHHSWTAETDFVENTLTLTGLAFGAWVEGTSISRMDRGTLVIDLESGEPVFMAGNWPSEPFDPDEAACDLIRAAL